MGFYLISSMSLHYGLPPWSWIGIGQEAILLVLAAIPCFLLFNGLHEYLASRVARTRTPKRRVARQFNNGR